MSEQMPPNIKEFAKICGLSVGTISGIINKKPGFKPETIAFVEQKMHEYKYHPNPYAQRMQRKHVGVIGICCQVEQTLFHAYLLKELIHFLRCNEYNTIVHYLQTEEYFEIARVPADAYLLMGDFPQVVKQIQQYRLRAAILDQTSKIPKMHHLTFDRLQAHEALVEYFLKRNHLHFGYIGEKSSKYEQFVDILQRHGKQLDYYARQADQTHAGSMFRELHDQGRHVAFFVPYEGHVLQFVMQCQLHHMLPGRDISAITWGMSYDVLLPEADFSRIGVFTDEVGQCILNILQKPVPERSTQTHMPLAFHHGSSVRDFRSEALSSDS